MDNEKIRRINELAKKSRAPEGLTLEERIEQQFLRQEYIDSCKSNLEAQLKNICYRKSTENDMK